MIRQLTATQLKKIDSQIELFGKLLLKKGCDPKEVSMRIWNKFGYPTEARNGVVIVKGYEMIRIEK